MSRLPLDDDERALAADYRRKQIRLPPVKPMGQAISQLLARTGYAQVQTAATCDAAWREAVGPKLAASTRPGSVKRGVLEVLVSNSTVLQELAFLKTKAVKTLKQLVPEQQIRDVRFRVGTID
jgi:predicted nucleic acid-binding Zn ribbon protein